MARGQEVGSYPSSQYLAEKLFLILSLNLFKEQFSMQQETSLGSISFITCLVFPAF